MTIDEEHKHLRVTHSDGKFAVARLKNDDHNLAPDEPVFVFRAADKHLAAILNYYAERCDADGSPHEHVQGAYARMAEVQEWQKHNPGKVKTPD